VNTTTSIEIARPADVVFDVIADMSRNTEWQKGMRSCRWTSDPPIGVGSTYEQTARFAGRDIVTTFEVTDFDPRKVIRIVSVVSTFPLDVVRRVVSLDDGNCRVIADVSGEPGGLMKLASPLTKRMVARSVAADYERLKQMLEDGD
jgi:hypothetical protein